MKKLSVIFILVLSLVSCARDKTAKSNTPDPNYYGNWKLIKMEGSMPNSATTGSAMEWQESYVFDTNGTFTKTRDTITAKGNFVVITTATETSLALTYSSSSTIIGNCTGDLKESLTVNSDGLLESQWRACDGPGLVYQKTE